MARDGEDPPHVILGVPGAELGPVEDLAGHGFVVAPPALTARAVRGQVAAVAADAARADGSPLTLLLHHRLPGATSELVASLNRVGVPSILLVDPASRGAHDLLSAGSRYPEYITEQARRLGCLGVASWPPDVEELHEAVALAQSPRMRATLWALARPQERARAAGGGTIGFCGAANGSGKTLVAANVAAHLGLLAERRVALLDLDPYNAGLHHALGLRVPGGRGLEALHAAAAPLVREATRRMLGRATNEDGMAAHPVTARERAAVHAAADDALDGFDLARYCVPYPSAPAAGRAIDALPGVVDVAEADRIAHDTETLHALVRQFARRYDDVLLDLGTEATNVVYTELAARADQLVFVTWPWPGSVTAVAAAYARLLAETGYPAARCRLVVNHAPADARAMIDPGEVMRLMEPAGMPTLGAVIPHDGDLVGRARLDDPAYPLLPVLLPDRAARKSMFVASIDELVIRLRPAVTAPPSRREGLTTRLVALFTPAPSPPLCPSPRVRQADGGDG